MKDKSDKVLFFLNTGIFPATVMFSCGFSYDEIMDILKRKRATDWYNGLEYNKALIESGNYFALHRQLMKGEKVEKDLFYIILTDRFTFTDIEFVKLAHECLHICQYFLQMCLDRNKEHEAEAYLHSHLMKQCLTILRK